MFNVVIVKVANNLPDEAGVGNAGVFLPAA
jgi:hypothetical protein